MSDIKEPIQPKFIKSVLQEAATYVALLTPILSPLLAWFGIKLDDKSYYIYAVVLLAFAVGWLLQQYKSAKKRISETGKMQRPAWLWKLLTNDAPFEKEEELQESSIMVFVPPQKESVAEKLDKEYNNDGNDILLFHYILMQKKAGVEDDKGYVKLNGETRSLKTLADEMKQCAALVLIEDCQWEKYPKTFEVIENWSKKNKVRPIISVRSDGRGTLKYNYSKLRDLIDSNRLLKNRLLAQSANRGRAWFEQARLYRKITLWSAVITLLFVFSAMTFSYINLRKYNELQIKLESLQNLNTTKLATQQEIARGFSNFREMSGSIKEDLKYKTLLEDQAQHLKSTIADLSGKTNLSNLHVILFAVKKNGENIEINEVAATRTPPNNLPFAEVQGEIQGIVPCAVKKRAFILWSGNVNGLNGITTNIEAWDFDGRNIGSYDSEILNIDSDKCTYKKRDKENTHRRLFCAPIGVINSVSDMLPVGAVCVSSPEDLDFLKEDWFRSSIVRFGNTLSFFSWEKALPSS